MKQILSLLPFLVFCIAPASSAKETDVNALLDGSKPYQLALPFSAYSAPDTVLHTKGDAPLEGRLRLTSSALSGGFQVYFDQYGRAKDAANKVRQLPPFDFGFVQSGNDLLPTVRTIVDTGHPYYDWILTPGKIWWESPTEARLSIPFALMENNENCIHNGVLMVRIDKEGNTSNALVQIGSETCAYFKFNFWAAYEASWAAEPVEGAEETRQTHSSSSAARLPSKPITDITHDYPALTLEKIDQREHIADVHMSAYGVLLNGVHYTGGCHTRMGTYPHCDQLVLPSYSLAKSLSAGIGLMRLEAMYPGVFEAQTSAHIPACDTDMWQGVSFENMLDMTTGNYRSAKAHVDEASEKYQQFFTARTAADKTSFSCNHFKSKSKPGKRWVYHTSDTYLLGVAMNSFLSDKTGKRSDYYKDLLVPIWKDLKLSPTSLNTRRTFGTPREPFSGYGMTLLADDTARLANALSTESSLSSRLDPPQLNAALQRNSDDRGKKGGRTELIYNNGFWGWNAKKVLRCKEDTWLPFLSGYGGISVILLPDGNVFYYFSDNYVHYYADAIKELSKVIPICGNTS